jgi:hypothetical protein
VSTQTLLNDKLKTMDFKTDSSVWGLLFTDKKYRDDPNVSFDQILILQQAQELKATAVYFRRIGDKYWIPQIFIYDNSNNNISQDEINDIHKKLWSSGIVPLYYVFDNTEVRIFNCRKPVNKTNLKATPSNVFSSVSDAHKKYSASLFQNGSFWELRENKNNFNINNSSYKKLIEGLKAIRDEFIKGQNEHICNKLLVLSIFVKYLEERQDKKGNRVLPIDYFNKYDGATCFCDVLHKKKGIQFFKDLGKDINGKIFKLTSQEEEEITKLDQSKLADFLDAKQDNYQYVLWKLYDFNYLPVELFSRIYEEFIPRRKDITYTPVHLVNFIIDECMPIGMPQKNDIKIIDVSCGSGIFLVAAFKRIVQWWQGEQYKNTGEIKFPKITKLKSILLNSIYGVDLEPEAVKLTIFSLMVALCDMLEPKKAWNELTEEKLIDLSENIIAQDFFDFIKTNKRFDLVIGNPPFNPPKETKEEQKKYWDEKVKYDWEIPDKNIALAFLQQAMKLLKEDGLLSLVIPSGPLLYNNTLDYRRNFLNKYNVPQIFDFSSLTGVLFEGRNYPVVVIFAQNIPPNDKDILHVTIRRTRTSKEKLYFEIDKYDMYYITKEIAKKEQLIWKGNQLGGEHLYYLVKRMQSLPKLEEYLIIKKKHNGWSFAEGYTPLAESTREPKKAPWLTNKKWIPTEKFINDSINDIDTDYEKAIFFHRTCEENKLIFKYPHILIKETPSLPVAFYDKDLIFRSEIMGIYAPEEKELLELRDNLISMRKFYKVLLLAISGRAGVSRSVTSILKKDIMELPYINKKNQLRLSKAEQIVCDDILDYGIDQLSKGEEAKVNTKEAKKSNIAEFAEVFCDSLNSIYKEGSKQFYPLEYIESLSFICLPFMYGNLDKAKRIPESQKKQIEKGDLESLIDNPQKTNVLFKRIIKLYPAKDMVYLVKPKLLRYWLKSIALRDANEVFTDLISSGY